MGEEGRIYMVVLADNDMMRFHDEGSVYGCACGLMLSEEVGLAYAVRMAGACPA